MWKLILSVTISKLILLVLVIFLASCGEIKKKPWPARITFQLSNRENEKKMAIEKAILELNTLAKKDIVFLLNQTIKQDHFNIMISTFKNSAEESQTAGYSIVDKEKCDLFLSETLFDEKKNYLVSVVWHELGHCAGLSHSIDQNSIMSASPKPMDFYSKEDIDNFISQLKSQIVMD